MNTVAWVLLWSAVVVVVYTYVGYPLALSVLARSKPARAPNYSCTDWPLITICLPAYNEELQIRGAIESLLATDYPPERRQILIVSDASTDRTDDIVQEYKGRGVELMRMPRRGGKTAAENAAALAMRGEIVVNTDASIRIRPDALKPLVAAFQDPTVGVASGRDVSVSRSAQDVNVGESGYVGYEMAIRALETRVGGIIGASGCFYAIKADLHRAPLPDHLSRDFASALIAHENGYRSVSVDGAMCMVPRAVSLRREYHRKVRTIMRGMETLWYKRGALNPSSDTLFAWMLLSHKLLRWLVPWLAVSATIGLSLLATEYAWAKFGIACLAAFVLAAAVGWLWPERRSVPRIFALPAAVTAANLAAMHSFGLALRGVDNPSWEPTRRDVYTP